MKFLKTLIFTCLLLVLCLGKAFAANCYTPNYGYYECNPNYQSYPYPYPNDEWGVGFFGIVIGGGGDYDGGYRGHGHSGHGNRDYHDGGHHHHR